MMSQLPTFIRFNLILIEIRKNGPYLILIEIRKNGPFLLNKICFVLFEVQTKLKWAHLKAYADIAQHIFLYREMQDQLKQKKILPIIMKIEKHLDHHSTVKSLMQRHFTDFHQFISISQFKFFFIFSLFQWKPQPLVKLFILVVIQLQAKIFRGEQQLYVFFCVFYKRANTGSAVGCRA